jgi:uncharacterized OB-fold protein
MAKRPEPRKDIYEVPFWEHVQRHDLRLQRCAACADLRFPPAPVCPKCLSADYGWAPLSGEGRVLGWTVFHRQYFPELPPPYTVVAVETDEGPVLVGDYVNAGERKVAVGDRVRLTYEEVDGEPDTWSIYQWEPVEETHEH